MLVCESLESFLNEETIAQEILNEKFDINSIASPAKKALIIASMLIALASSNGNSTLPKEELAKNPAITALANKDKISREDINNTLKEVTVTAKVKPAVFEVTKPLIRALDKVMPGRLYPSKMPRYNQYDADILEAVKELETAGEKPNINMIKAIMLIETGMNPKVNHLGFEGFPQTKEHIVKAVNKRNKTKFYMKDMYNAKQSAKYIHYYVKTIKKSKYVKTSDDIIIAYNWGIGNLGAYKNGEKTLPSESKNYVAMMNILKKYF
jgi:hypothetical protein